VGSTIAVLSGHRLSSLAMSPCGVLARVLDAVGGDTALLVVAREGRHAQVALPASAGVRWQATDG
jgi:hypothetical protein